MTLPAAGPPLATGHVFIATSLDGFIARRDGGLDWLDKYAGDAGDHGYTAFMAKMDGLVMGRATFEKVLTFGAWPFDKPVVVMSRTLAEGDLGGDLAGKARVTAAAPEEVVATLSAEGWRRIYVDGGQVIRAFLRQGLIAELVLTRVPVILGGGIALFGDTAPEVPVRHIATTAFPSGLVQSTYAVVRPG